MTSVKTKKLRTIKWLFKYSLGIINFEAPEKNYPHLFSSWVLCQNIFLWWKSPRISNLHKKIKNYVHDHSMIHLYTFALIKVLVCENFFFSYFLIGSLLKLCRVLVAILNFLSTNKHNLYTGTFLQYNISLLGIWENEFSA